MLKNLRTTAVVIAFVGHAALALGSAPQFWALCAHEGHGTRGWTGAFRATRAEAERDAQQHNASNQGHDASVVQ